MSRSAAPLTREPFGISVRKCMTWDKATLRHTDVPAGMWDVFLPYEGGRSQITDNPWATGVAHDEAVADLEAFIAEAQAALVALKAQREFGEDD